MKKNERQKYYISVPRFPTQEKPISYRSSIYQSVTMPNKIQDNQLRKNSQELIQDLDEQ